MLPSASKSKKSQAVFGHDPRMLSLHRLAPVFVGEKVACHVVVKRVLQSVDTIVSEERKTGSNHDRGSNAAIRGDSRAIQRFLLQLHIAITDKSRRPDSDKLEHAVVTHTVGTHHSERVLADHDCEECSHELQQRRLSGCCNSIEFVSLVIVSSRRHHALLQRETLEIQRSELCLSSDVATKSVLRR